MVDLVSSEHMQWIMPRGGHRGEGVEFKTLFAGDGGEGNYWFTLVRIQDRYHTPAHRHMFDQVRIMLDGGFNFGPQVQPEGSVGYFTEGTTYEQSADAYSFHLLLQTEGASRTPYVQADSMGKATQALKLEGEFVDGIYRARRGDQWIEQDGFEAVFERATGRPPHYSEPRYERPVIMQPELFAWTPDPVQSGVWRKMLGVFTERLLTLSMVRIDPSATGDVRNDGRSLLLGFVRSGSGEADDQPFEANSGLRIEPETVVRVTTRSPEPVELFLLQLPS